MLLLILAAATFSMAALFTAVNLYQLNRFQPLIRCPDDVEFTAQAALLPGSRVYPDNRVSAIVYDRLVVAAELYKRGLVKKILVSGDHGRVEYDEVNTIKKWLLDMEIPEQDIFTDHAGFSTYESIYRAKEIFQVESMLIVTQKFHLPRALYLADRFAIKATGVVADRRQYAARHKNNVREWLARFKDFIYADIVRPLPRYLGDKIPISGDGRMSNG